MDCGERYLTYPGNRICHRNSPPLYTTHTLMAGGDYYTDGCPDLWTNTISHKQLRFFWPLDSESVCNPTVYSSAKMSNLVNYKFSVWKQPRIYASGCEIQLILVFILACKMMVCHYLNIFFNNKNTPDIFIFTKLVQEKHILILRFKLGHDLHSSFLFV